MRRGVPLSLFWFFYLGGLGIFFPYYSLYLRENAGLTGTQVGVVLATLPLVGMVAQPLWGQVADRTGARSTILSLLAFGAAVGLAALAAVRGFPAFVLTTAALATCSTAVVPMSVSVSLAALRDQGPHAFGLVRVWGTLGFLLFVVGFPWALNHLQRMWGLSAEPGGPSEPGLHIMFLVSSALALAAALVGPLLPRGGGVALRASRGDWPILFRQEGVVRLLLFALIGYLCLQGPMGLFPVYVRAHGGDMDTVGRMWIVMLMVEIPLVALSGAGLERVGARGLLAIGVLAGGVRWTICGLTDDIRIVYLAQSLHGVVVTGLILGGPLYLEAIVPERLRSTGQALLAMAGIGLGGIVSNTAAGWLLEHVGTDAPYLAGGMGAIALGCLVRWILPVPARG